MATFPGTLSDSFTRNDGDVINPALGLRDVPVGDEGFQLSDSTMGTLDSQQPVDLLGNTFSGSISEMYAMLHWYNRIHIQYSDLNLGNVVGDQEIDFWVLNTFLIPQTLDEIIPTGVEGLTLIEPDTPPFDFAPFEEKTYTLLIDANGPPAITAQYDFVFPGYRTLSININGVRVVGWIWEPNWENPVRERLIWVTDGTDSYNNTPQRIQQRQYPIQTWDFSVDLDERRQRTIENALYAWSGRTWAVPVWPDVEVLEVETPSGSESITLIETETRAYFPDTLAIFIHPNGNLYETTEIESVEPTGLTFKRGLSRTWPIGTKVFPVVFCRLTNGGQLSRFKKDWSYASISFKSEKGRPWLPAVESVTYRGYPVMTRMPEWNIDPTHAYIDLLDIVESEFEQAFYDKKTDTPNVYQSFSWRSFGRTEIDALRKFLYARRGRVRAVWVSTYSEDLVLTATVSSVGTTLEVEAAGLVQFIRDGAINRRDVRIELVTGQVFYRRVSEFAPVNDDRENLSLDSAIGIEMTPQNVARISWMSLMRLDTDSVEIVWDSPLINECLLSFRGARDDV